MIRRSAVAHLGGWDEVRVAADNELHQRLVRAYGKDSIARVLPGIPLVLARQLPGSLTMTPATHLRSQFFGLRRLYTELAETWHGMAKTPEDLRLTPSTLRRAFPAPAPILNTFPVVAPYDYLLIADLSGESKTHAINQAQVRQLLAQGQRIALFHWPEYERPEPIDSLFLRHAVQGGLDIILAEQQIDVDCVLIIGRHLLSKPLDHVPALRFGKLRLIDALLACPDDATSPELFDANWYLRRYPDVQAADTDPWRHYLRHGAAEGRDPGPSFNTAHYLAQCRQARDSDMPPLLHYLRTGRSHDYDASHPFLPGSQTRRPGHSTLLLCAHAADHELFGAERCLLDVLDACATLALNVLVSVPTIVNSDYVAALRAKSLGVVCIPHIPWFADSAPCQVAIERLVELIHSQNVDLVHVNTITLREPLLAARQVGAPSFVHVHESPLHDPDLAAAIGLPAEQIVEHVLANADYILANSAFTAQHFDKPGKTNIVGNIVDVDAFDLPNNIDAAVITAALISSNLPKKGLADVEALASLLAHDTPNLRLLLIGPDSAYVAQLREAMNCGRAPGNLQIMPYAESPQVALTQANIVLNLSRCQETFGRTALEGLAAGRPVLAYLHGALPELIEDGITGFLVAAGDIPALAERLRELCRDPQRILQMGAAGRRSAENHDFNRLCRQLAQAYGQTLPLLRNEPAGKANG